MCDSPKWMAVKASRLAQRYPSLEYEDALQEAWLATRTAESSYNPDKGASFDTYAQRVVEFRLLDWARRQQPAGNRRLRNGTAKKTFQLVDEDREEDRSDLDAVDSADWFESILQLFEERTAEILRLKFQGELSNAAIAQEIGISPTRVGQLLKESYEEIRKWLRTRG